MKILCVGDSHSRLLATQNSKSKFRYGRVCSVSISTFEQASVLAIKGATAAGFRPAAGKRSSFSAASHAINDLNPDLVCFGFGQVDAELSCYFVALRDGVELETAIQSRIDLFDRYLYFCREAASKRIVLVKGLNTSTLHSESDLHKMLIRNLPDQMGIPRNSFSRWLEKNEITVKRHREINSTIAGELQRQTVLAGIPYFDVREITGLRNQPGLTKPEYCSRNLDVHLSQSRALAAHFSEALSNLALTTQNS